MRKSRILLAVGMILASQSAFAATDLKTHCSKLGGRFESQQQVAEVNYTIGVAEGVQEAMQLRLAGSNAWYFIYNYSPWSQRFLEESVESGVFVDVCIRPSDSFILGAQRSRKSS